MGSSDLWYSLDWLALVTLLAIVGSYHLRSRRTFPLPPGPKGLPIIGNFLDLPKSFASEQFRKWGAQYGDIISLTIFGKVIIVLTAHRAVEHIVHNVPSSHVASRPSIKLAEITGVQRENPFIMVYGQRWRDRRRIIDKALRSASIEAYIPTLQERIFYALDRMMREPDLFKTHIRECTNAVILLTVYGHRVEDASDSLIITAEEWARLVVQILLPSASIINVFPALSVLPTWIFGFKFAKMLDRITYLSHKASHTPFDMVKENMVRQPLGVSEKHVYALVRDSLEQISKDDVSSELVLKDAFGAIYGAAADTTVASLSTFLLAMLLYPAVQEKARAELDAVVGRDKLPTLSDRPQLPYLDAVLQETLRWNSAVPQGVPHVASEDILWDGYVIPKGATIICNSWGILRDPELYFEPDRFNPERFISPDGLFMQDPKVECVFGFGVRKCPGRLFFDMMLWLFASNMIAEFTFDKKPDSSDISEEFVDQGLVVHPAPFECKIAPRDMQAIQLIEDAVGRGNGRGQVQTSV